MAPPTKRYKLETAKEEEKTHGLSAPPPTCIPQEVIFFNILDFLSSKTLTKFKCVCKSWCLFISGDPLFPLHQGRRAVSSSAASGMVFSNCWNTPLVVVPTSGAPIGVPDPHLTFVPGHCLSVRASTNGLLCLQCKTISSKEFLYVCNPATKEGHVVPNFKFKFWTHYVGLAFDPVNSPDRYKLVCPQQNVHNIVFKVFSSETSKWVKSSQKLRVVRYMNFKFDLVSSIYVGGVLYWNLSDYVLYFDPETDVAGIVLLPFELRNDLPLWRQGSHDIGVCGGRVTCARFSIKSGLEVWIMSSAARCRWEKKYQMGLERMLELNLDVLGTYWRMTTLRSRKLIGEMTSDNYIVPLMFDGGSEVHLWVKKRNKVLCFDMNSGRVTEFCKYVRPVCGVVFLYANSMVPLPKLSPLP